MTYIAYLEILHTVVSSISSDFENMKSERTSTDDKPLLSYHYQVWNGYQRQVAQRATIAHLSPMCQVNLPQNLLQPFPHPNDATHKIWSRLTNWLQRYSSSKVWNFRHSRASNSKMSGLIRPKIELDRAFMPILVTSNFDDDLIKNEQASIETPFFHYKSMGNFLDAQEQLTP